MVGAAQYHDDEIGWVLSAVVGKKKQSYIQIHFKEKFGRSLNHNQIRYIKNKYGKDPRFKIATSPKPDLSSEHGDEDGQGNGADFGSLNNEAGPSTQGGDKAAAVTQPKRKRSGHDAADVLESLIKQTTKSQRLDVQPRQAATPELIACEAPAQRVKTAGSHLPALYAHTLSSSAPIASSLEGGCPASLYGPAYDNTQFPNTSTGVDWTSSVSLSGHSWRTDNSPVLTSVGGNANASASIQPSPVPAERARLLSRMPATAQYQLQLPPYRLAALPVSQVSPPTPNIASPPYLCHQEQHQQRQQRHNHQLLQRQHQPHPYMGAPGTPVLPTSVLSQMEEHPPFMHHVPRAAYQLVPSFQEIPIEPASSEQANQQSVLAGGGVCQDYKGWDQITAASSPHALSLFNPRMDFPFQNVRYTGLTAASSQAIRQSLLSHPDVHGPNLVTQQQQQQQHHLAPQPDQEHLDFGASTLQLLSMIHRPAFATVAMPPHSQPSNPAYDPTTTFSPPVTQPQPQPHQNRPAPRPQAYDLHDAASDFAGTIDPRLLIGHHNARSSASPYPHPSPPPPSLVNHEMEPPPS
ncbi:hypothetical protein Trco_002654 [Trichoderma cornu-damae]|uniref:Uncharacterized protein n=1 Tax=Trichoderma cornu-damae TaxID=654480 RepID=A0A9P8TY78_9HYPO|nr:hypothetical protein Trco_002654 [Trichoderma cornu-damae]